MPRAGIDETWFKWLQSEGIDFAIRVKKNTRVTNGRGCFVQARQLFRTLKPGETLVLAGARKMTGTAVYLSALRLDDGELLVVATPKPCLDAIETYALRWQIGTLFGCLKSRGFNFGGDPCHRPPPHLPAGHKKRLRVVAVIAFCWAHRVGEWQHEQIRPIKIKKHHRPAKSIFRLGLDIINEALFDLAYDFGRVIDALFPFLCGDTAFPL